MNEYKKTKSVQVGIKGTLEDLMSSLIEQTIHYGENFEWYYGEGDKVTAKIKGKNVDLKDIQIFIEETD